MSFLLGLLSPMFDLRLNGQFAMAVVFPAPLYLSWRTAYFQRDEPNNIDISILCNKIAL